MAAEVFDFEGAGERYKFLLQPVKDLASNWNLDIAKNLEDYIQKVVEENDSAVLVDRNGRRKVFNFAEAALLIYGTTTVYVKKVEYVHQLALNFFDELKEDKQPEKRRKKGAAEENNESAEGIEEVGDGDPGNDAESGQPKKKQKPNNTAMRTLLERLSHRRAIALPLVPIAFFPLSDFEKSDVPLFTRTNAKEQIGKKDDFRINSCHIHESVALLDLKNVELVDKFSKQIRSSHTEPPHRSTTGAGCHTLEPLIERTIEEDMEGLDLTSQSQEQQQQAIALWNESNQQQNNGQMNGVCNSIAEEDNNHFDGGDLDDMDAMINDRTLTEENQAEERSLTNEKILLRRIITRTAIGVDDLCIDEADDNEIVPPTPPDSSAISANEIGREQNSTDQIRASNLENADLLRPSTILCHSRPISAFDLRNSSNRNKELNWEEILQDVLDPIEMVNEQSKPFRKKATCVTNAAKQIKARERRIEKECLERGIPNDRSVKSYIDTQMYRPRVKKRAFAFGQFNSFLMDQAVLALSPLIHEEEKRRNDLRKKRRREQQAAERAERAAHRSSQRSLDPVLDHPNEDEEEDINQQPENGPFMDGNGLEIDEFEDGLEELIAEEKLPVDGNTTIGGDEDYQANLGDILEMDDLENSLGGIQNMYTGFKHIISSKRRDKNAIASKLVQTIHNTYDDTLLFDGEFNPEDLPNDRPPSQMDYDEIIAYHLRKYWTASEAAMSKFSRQIQMWETKMTIALEEEQSHRNFDTRQYGDELMDMFGGQVGSIIDFTEMLNSIPDNYDRSRFLLISLILANMGNVEVQITARASNSLGQDGQEDMETIQTSDSDQIKLKLISSSFSRFDLNDPPSPP